MFSGIAGAGQRRARPRAVNGCRWRRRWLRAETAEWRRSAWATTSRFGNGRDELVHRPLPAPVPSKLCRVCWRRRPLRDFDKRLICRRCIRLRNSARLRAYRESARGEGVCQACLKRPVAGSLTICETCRLHRRELNAERRRRRAGEPHCVSCSEGLPPGWKRQRCGACIEAARRRDAELRQSRLAEGLCGSCGKSPRAVTVRGELATHCRSCIDRAAEGKRMRAARRALEGARA